MGVYCQRNSLSVLSPTNTCVPELNCNPYVLWFSDLKMWMFCPKDGWDWSGDEHSRMLKNEGRNSTTQSAGTSHNKEQSATLSNLREQAGRNRYSVVERKATHVLAHLSSSNSFHYSTAEPDPLKRPKVGIKRIYPEQQLLWPCSQHVMMLLNCLFSSFQNKFSSLFRYDFKLQRKTRIKMETI